MKDSFLGGTPAVPVVRVSRSSGPSGLRAKIPAYQSAGAAGCDLHAALDEPVAIPAGDRRAIPTGLILEIPPGFEGQVRPRSGLAAKQGVTLLNSPGTIDSDYRGEVIVLLHNTGREPFVIEDGLRIAQLIIAPVFQARFELTDKPTPTTRGSGGFGSTGI